MIPEVNKTYNYFDDGKIRESRRETVKILKLIPFDKVSKKLLKQWWKEVNMCDWLYKTNTDYFVKGYLEETKEEVIFARTKNDGWFSLGWNAGRLDIDGSLTEQLKNYSW